MQKKIFAILCAILTLCTSFTSFAEDEWVDLKPTLLPIIDYSAHEWYSTSANRTISTVLAAFDCVISGHDEFEKTIISAIYEDAIYVARTDDVLFIFFFGIAEGVIMLYRPESNLLSISKIDIDSDLASYFLSQGVQRETFTTYTHVDADDFIEFSTEISELLS